MGQLKEAQLGFFVQLTYVGISMCACCLFISLNYLAIVYFLDWKGSFPPLWQVSKKRVALNM